MNNELVLKKPLLIDFEGIDGTFKYTTSGLLQDYIENTYTHKVVNISFPNYNGESSYLLREYFRYNNKVKKLSPKIVSELFMLDMYDSWCKEIESFYKDNYIIIFDRYYFSNTYYNGINYIFEDPNNIKNAIDFASNNDKYIEFSNIIDDLRKEFKLPDVDLIYKMNHNIIDIRNIIEKRIEEDTSHNADINENSINYLNNVNYALMRHNFKSKANQYTINLDKNENEYLTKEEILDLVKIPFDKMIHNILKDN